MVCDLALTRRQAAPADLYEAVMRSHARLTYDRVAKRSPASPIRKIGPFGGLEGRPRAVEEAHRAAARAGSIDFDLPRPRSCSTTRATSRRSSSAPQRCARLIEEFMLAANEASPASSRCAPPTVYRIHDQPDQEKLRAFAGAGALARIRAALGRD